MAITYSDALSVRDLEEVELVNNEGIEVVGTEDRKLANNPSLEEVGTWGRSLSPELEIFFDWADLETLTWEDANFIF